MSGTRSLFTKTARSAKKLEAPYMEALIKKDKDWSDIEVWQAMKTASRVYTPAYLAAAVDLKMLADGSIVRQDEDRRIHVILFWRTLEISFLVTIFCFILGYPAYMLSTYLRVPLTCCLFWCCHFGRPYWCGLLRGSRCCRRRAC